MKQLPLRCRVKRGAIHIVVGAETVKFATDNHPDLWDGDTDTYRYVVTDPQEWLKSVAHYINDELGEDGSSRLSRMLDSAIMEALEQGWEGCEERVRSTASPEGGA